MDEKVKKRKVALYTTLEVVATFILTMVGAMWDWVNMEFTFQKVTTQAYWDNVIIQTVMYTCALVLGTLMTLEKMELKNSEYLDIYKYYQETMYPKKDKGFEPYVNDVLNPKIKKEFLHKKYEKKLYKLDRIAKDKWKIEFREASKLEEPLTYQFSSKLSKKYFIRRCELEEINSDEYINENYEILSVRYPRVNAHAFTKYLDIKLSDTSKYKVENKVAKGLAGKIASKLFYSILAATIIGLLIINPDTNALLEQANGWIALLIQYIIRVAMIFINFTMGVYSGRSLFIENFILPINNRNRILDEYDVYKQDHPALTEIELEHKKAKKEAEKEFNTKVEEQVNLRLAEEISKLKKDLDRVQ